MNGPKYLFCSKHQLLAHLVSAPLVLFLRVLPDATSLIFDSPSQFRITWVVGFLDPLPVFRFSYLGCSSMDRSGTLGMTRQV